jgi:hypothetical protein
MEDSIGLPTFHRAIVPGESTSGVFPGALAVRTDDGGLVSVQIEKIGGILKIEITLNTESPVHLSTIRTQSAL